MIDFPTGRHSEREDKEFGWEEDGDKTRNAGVSATKKVSNPNHIWEQNCGE